LKFSKTRERAAPGFEWQRNFPFRVEAVEYNEVHRGYNDGTTLANILSRNRKGRLLGDVVGYNGVHRNTRE